MTTMEINKIHIDWSQYFGLCDDIVKQIVDYETKYSTNITDIIGIARGGLMPAQYIAYKLGVKQIHNCGIISYSEDDQKMDDDKVIMYQRPLAHFNKTSNVLIIDDIADTGKTFEKSLTCHCLQWANTIRLAALHYKPSSSSVKLDFYGQKIDKKDWIVYPYD
jgi:hypoxanthine phosphoribosyltransferase